MRHFSNKWLLSGGGLVGVAVLAMLPVAAGATSTVTQSYSAGAGVLPGMVVELQPHSQTVVEPLAAKDTNNMAGVVVPINDSPLVLTQQSTSGQQVLVAGAGHYNLLVSTQNGPIKANDYLAVSALSGIVMKAGTDQKQVVGRALGSFSGSNALGSVALKGSTAGATVAVGVVPANVQLMANPLYINSTNLPTFLGNAANSVAHKSVAPLRVYLSITLMGVVLIITGSMFYGSTRSGILAIGRNPLAKKFIGRGLIQAVLFALIVFVIGMFGAYLILL